VGGICYCTGGFGVCGGTCRNLLSDRNNCGGCGIVCSGPPGAVGCVNGTCTCAAGLTQCGNACVNLAFDRNNCGGCGVICASNLTCKNSACVAP
jgi:hypothetical protein